MSNPLPYPLLCRLARGATSRERRSELASVLADALASARTSAQVSVEQPLLALADRWALPIRERAPTPFPISTIVDQDYPTLLRDTPDPPALVFHTGDIACAAHICIAVVGSRRAAPSSMAVAHDLAFALARAGVVVVSGLAHGVDGAAHRGALAAEGLTIAVLGGGLDRPYPAAHRALFHAVRTRGVVLSEYPPGMPPRPAHFPQRNRLISGMSRAVVVIEAAERSGSLGTARQALEQGRDVLVVPGTVVGGRFAGSHALIRDGAVLVESATDVLAALEIAVPPASEHATNAEEPLLAVLSSEPTTIDALVHSTGMDAQEIRRRLMIWELEGVVAATAHGYSRVR